MLKKLIEYFITNKENILYFISVSAFLMSLFNTYIYLKNKFPKIKVKIMTKEEGANKFILSVMFENNCELPVSINNITVRTDNSPLISCHLTHQWIGEHYYPKCTETDIPITERMFSADFPINLNPYQSTLSFVAFNLDGCKLEDILDSVITMNVVTNRKKYRIKFDLNKIKYKDSLLV